ncbi:MAG: DEAD/DEAH box helicase [Phycisphaerales bacterium]|nr:DEAD/DEAH box helicase [Phycisphaerales bacterium]
MDLQSLDALVPQAMLRDQWNFRRRLAPLRQRRLPAPPALIRQIQASVALRTHRERFRPRPTFPPELPVSEKRDEIARAIMQNQVVVICGETGSGKTTQLPKICLELGRGIAGMIGHTQPRRIAARSVCARIAQELHTRVGHGGGHVAYKIRFSDTVSDHTNIKLMTDGILLAETQNDRFLNQYDTLILDEAHERSLNIDFLLGYLKQLLPRRPDLKLIITSATIDPVSFSKHFENAPIVMVSGRTYPVELRYREPYDQMIAGDDPSRDREGGTGTVPPPPSLSHGRSLTVAAQKCSDPQDFDEEEPDFLQALIAAVDEVVAEGPGDVLVFLSGEREIREAASELESHLRKGRGVRVDILPLFARLSAAEQQRIFEPSGRRRIILATNIAETSLTVPGIRYVIDPGLARISRYAPRSQVQRLPIEPISQASANQRMGRCGRVSAGVCIRLYSEENFLARPLFTEPEILRTNLAAVILQMKALRLGSIEAFPFIDRPGAKLIADGYQTLLELGAINKQLELTALGGKLARLPIDPRLARMIVAAADEGVEKEVLIIAAALSVQDPRERPLEQQQAADAAHMEFRDEDSDFLSYLKLWEWYHRQAKSLSSSKLRRACREHFFSYTRLREWQDIHQQLQELLQEQ